LAVQLSIFSAPNPVHIPDVSPWQQPISGAPDPISDFESEKSGKGSGNNMQVNPTIGRSSIDRVSFLRAITYTVIEYAGRFEIKNYTVRA